MAIETTLGRAGSPLPAAHPFANCGAHGVTRPTHLLILTGALTLLISVLFGGCVTEAQAGARERAAYLAGQKAALASIAGGQGVAIIGPVEHPNVPWVEGLTLAQAIATANYTSHRNPKAITITRQGEEISVNPRDLIGGHVVPLQPGDTIRIE
jgi:hypothetical protein